MASLGNLYFKIGADVKEAVKGIDQVKNKVEDIRKLSIFSGVLQGANAAIGVFNSIVGAIKPLVQEFDNAAKAAAKLETALKGNKVEAGQLIQQASDLARTRLFPADQTVNAQATLAALGLTKTTIQQLIPVIQDFASAQGLDLVSASQAVGKAVAVGGDALKKYGVSIGEAKNQSERYKEVVNGLTSAFSGQAAAAAQVGAGPLQLLIQQFSSLKEIAGESLVRFANELIPKSSEGLNNIQAVMATLPVHAENLGRAFNYVFGGVYGVYNTLVKIDTIIGKPLQGIQKLIQGLFGIEAAQERVKNRSDLVQPGYAAQQAGINTLVSTLDNYEKKTKTVSAAEVARLDLLKVKSDEAAAAIGRVIEKANLPLTSFEKALFKQDTLLQPFGLPQGKIGEVKSQADDPVKKVIEEQIKVGKEFNNTLSTTKDELGAIGSAAVNAFAGLAGGLLDGSIAFKDLGRAALQAAGQIIKAALAEALAAGIAKSIKKSPNILVGIAIAGVAVAAILSLFKRSVPKLAGGGLAYRPQLAVVGDNPNAAADPEVISPLSKLNSLLANQINNLAGLLTRSFNQSIQAVFAQPTAIAQPSSLDFRDPLEIVVKGKIDGSDIRLAYDRAESIRNRHLPKPR